MAFDLAGGFQYAGQSSGDGLATTGGTMTGDLLLDVGADLEVYNLNTDASNYERGYLRWDSNTLKFGAEAAGTGTQRALEVDAGSSQTFKVGGANYLTLYLNSVRFSKDLETGGATVDIGTSTDAFNDAYFGGQVYTKGVPQPLADSQSDTQPAATGSAQDLTSHTLAAAALATDGDKVVCCGNGENSGATTAEGTLRVQINAVDVFDTGDAAGSAGDGGIFSWWFEAVRASATTVRCRGYWIFENSTTSAREIYPISSQITTNNLTSSTNVIESQGTATDATTDVTQKTFELNLVPMN